MGEPNTQKHLIRKGKQFVILYPISAQESLIFFTERTLLVVARLIADIQGRPLQNRRTDRKGTISPLPRESRITDICPPKPSAAVGFDGTNEIRQTHGLRQRGQDMEVVGHASNFNGYPIQISDDAGNVTRQGGEIIRTDCNAHATYMKNKVDVDFS